MKKFLIVTAFLFGIAYPASASEEYLEVGCSSFTSIYTSSMTMQVSSVAFSMDGISVINPGVSSSVEVWDWSGSTVNADRYLGRYDTTSKTYHQEGNWGIKISTNILIFNQGSTPAGIKVFWRSRQAGLCRPVF